ncbi:hypothetical protein JD844_004096 [Phrynosoma platyrhinos]|uniref:Uncharacterized protein n=1 Tax=Phrynosoma platyrhinos TaxID=52577 RepID=A0ABQ7TMM9_PHRPL|nr:hypothetical protein JD844_004096 [Phrynosoma platyrhinos]
MSEGMNRYMHEHEHDPWTSEGPCDKKDASKPELEVNYKNELKSNCSFQVELDHRISEQIECTAKPYLILLVGILLLSIARITNDDVMILIQGLELQDVPILQELGSALTTNSDSIVVTGNSSIGVINNSSLEDLLAQASSKHFPKTRKEGKQIQRHGEILQHLLSSSAAFSQSLVGGMSQLPKASDDAV